MHLEHIVRGHGRGANWQRLAQVVDLVLTDDVTDLDRNLALVELDGHDGDRVAAAARAVEVDEEEALALGQETHPAAAVTPTTCGTGEGRQLRAQPVRAVHLTRV